MSYHPHKIRTIKPPSYEHIIKELESLDAYFGMDVEETAKMQDCAYNEDKRAYPENRRPHLEIKPFDP